MTKRKPSGGVLIVVELGADWPSLAGVQEPANARRVLAQSEGESPSSFVLRLAEQLDNLFARGVAMSTAIVACNERLDEAAQRARTELARTALGAMAKERAGSLLLSASDRSSARLRQALSSLASELGSEWQRAGVSSKVRFGDEQPAPMSPEVSVSVDAAGAPHAPHAKDGRRKVA
jgi:hypothetical protein